MNANQILWPVLAQIALTLAMFILLGVRKARAVKAGEVDRRAAALDNRAWPADVLKVSNNIANQFETPVLFFALCLLFRVSDQVDMAALVLAWVYAISRYVHAWVHVGSNFVPLRLRLFLVGFLSLIALSILAAVRLAA